MSRAGEDFVERLRSAVDAHDIERVADCFAVDYVNETPVHPGRGFVGREQVRTNWERIFAGVPDVRATVSRVACDGDVVWSEWEMTGTRPDGSPHLMRGVNIFGVKDTRAAWARFYLEPVDAGEGGVNAAIGAVVQDGRS